jgi:hypothetical protein
MDTLDLEIESVKPSMGLTNDGRGLLYSDQSLEFTLPPALGVDIKKAQPEGTLTYSVSYNVIGSKVRHHSSKTLRLTILPKGLHLQVIDEHED